jgi:hypothetical protein
MSYNFDQDRDYINGYAAECLLAGAIQQSKKIHTWDIESQVLAEAISRDPAGRKHLNIAEPFLVKEFAEISIDEIGRKSFTLPALIDLPAVTILDRVLGLDYCVKFFGYQIGIDVTVDPNTEVKKLRKKRELASVYSHLGFDKIVILIVNNTFDSQVLEAKLKLVNKYDAANINHTVVI